MTRTGGIRIANTLRELRSSSSPSPAASPKAVRYISVIAHAGLNGAGIKPRLPFLDAKGELCADECACTPAICSVAATEATVTKANIYLTFALAECFRPTTTALQAKAPLQTSFQVHASNNVTKVCHCYENFKFDSDANET